MPDTVMAWLARDRRNVMAAAALVLLLALALRLVNIDWSYSNNGIDEGIMLQRALLVGDGYDLYTDIPLDQAPLAFLVGGLLDGDIVLLRTMTALLSVGAIGAMMFLSRKLAGDIAMLLTGALLAADFVLLRESRLFSLDALCASFGAFSLLAFHRYSERGSVAAIGVAGVLAGVATSVKLLGGLFLLGFVAYMAFRWYSSRKVGTRGIVDLTVLLASAAAPIGALMLYLGPSEMIDGMVFGQGHRDFDPYLKLSVLAFFAIDFAYILPLVRAREMWKARPAVRYLFLVVAVLLAFMVLQPLVFLHHMVLLELPARSAHRDMRLRPHCVRKGAVIKQLHCTEKETARSGPRGPRDSPRGRVPVVVLGRLRHRRAGRAVPIQNRGHPRRLRGARELGRGRRSHHSVVRGHARAAGAGQRRVQAVPGPHAREDRGEHTGVRRLGSGGLLPPERVSGAVSHFLVDNGYVQVYPDPEQTLPMWIVVPVLPPVAVLDLFQDGIGWVTIYVRGDLVPAT